jgi:GT2 family glycosyltransferase
LKPTPYEVIVVDSNSQDGTEKLEDVFPIKYVSIEERSRQRALNLGISIANGEIVAFLDDDITVDKKWLANITEPYTNATVGGVGGRVIPYGKKQKHYVRTRQNTVGRVYSSGLVIGNFDLPSEHPIEVDSLIGCNMSFRRDLLLKVGGFDVNYKGTSYRDDTDLCIRIRKSGCALIYCANALVWHKYKGKLFGADWSYWYVRNNVYFYLKNLFAQDRLKIPVFIYSMFIPPRDYLLKSSVEVKIGPVLIPKVIKGAYDGYKTWHKPEVSH